MSQMKQTNHRLDAVESVSEFPCDIVDSQSRILKPISLTHESIYTWPPKSNDTYFPGMKAELKTTLV